MPDRPDHDGETTHFGFQTVPMHEKTVRVQQVFESVATRYDLMNDLMSAGIHRLWKDAVVDWLAPCANQPFLDIAGGTGDIALRILRRSPQARVSVVDLTEAMLTEGRERAARTVPGGQPEWVCGNAMALPFASRTFEGCTFGFGIRNVAQPARALEEAQRVLKHGGRLLILEFSQPCVPLLEWLYDRYSFNVLPALGQMVAGDRDSYLYLVESIRRFPDQMQFAAMMEDAGFERVSFRNLSGGIACLHSGWKL